MSISLIEIDVLEQTHQIIVQSVLGISGEVSVTVAKQYVLWHGGTCDRKSLNNEYATEWHV